MLQAGELDGEAFFEVTHDAALYGAERDQRADRRPLVGGDTGARLRNVDDAAGEVDAVRHDQAADRVARHDTAVAAVFRQAEDVAVGEPGELGGKLVAFARGRPDGHRKAVLENARDVAFEPAQMIDIGDDALARRAAHRRDQRHAPRRHVDDLAGKLAAVRQHIAAEQVDLDALMAAAVLAERPQTSLSFNQSHAINAPATARGQT